MTVDHPEEEKCHSPDGLIKPHQEEQGHEDGHQRWIMLYVEDLWQIVRPYFPPGILHTFVSESQQTLCRESKIRSNQVEHVKTSEESYLRYKVFQALLHFTLLFRVKKWAYVLPILFILPEMSNASYCYELEDVCYGLKYKDTSSSCEEDCRDVRCLLLTTDDQVDLLQNCSHLNEIYLSGPNITQFPWGPLKHLDSVHHVHVTNTSINKLDADGQTCESITKIFAENNPISDISEFLPAFPNLKEGHFPQNHITKIPPIDRQQNKQLSKLGLENNKLEDLNLKYYSQPSVVFNFTIKDGVITTFDPSGTKTVINIAGNNDTISCQDNKVMFDQSVTVVGNFSCVNKNGTPGVEVLPFQEDAASGISPAVTVLLVSIILLVAAACVLLIVKGLMTAKKKRQQSQESSGACSNQGSPQELSSSV